MTKTRTINFGRISPTTTAMFDILADGEWHEGKHLQWEGALALITADWDTAYNRGLALRAKSVASGRHVEPHEYALSGANDRARNNLDIACRSKRIIRRGTQYRMLAETVRAWKTIQAERNAARMVTTEGHNPMKIRTFAGINEHDAFHSAPVRVRDRVMFRTNHPIPPATFQATTTLSWSFTLDDSTGLYRIDGPAYHGRIIEAQVHTWCEDSGIVASDLRIVTNVKNRDLADLDPNFLNELVAFYQPFLERRLRKAGTSLQVHIPEAADQYQQIGEWVVSCVREYDETKGVPFGAFLVTRASHRVHDLQRNRVGRTAADNQNQIAKVQAAFSHEHGRTPTRAEMADLMGKTETEYASIVAALDVATKVHDPMSIQGMHDDNQEIQVAAEADAASSILDLDESATISAALLSACVGDDGTPNLVAFGHWYYKGYCNMTKAQAASAMGVSTQTVSTATDRTRTRLSAALEDMRTR